MKNKRSRRREDDALGLDESLRQALAAASVPQNPGGEQALLARLRPLLTQKNKTRPLARLWRCMRRELTALPLPYAGTGILLAGLTAFLSRRVQPDTLLFWMFFLPVLPVAAGLTAFSTPRSRSIAELASTFLFDYRQLLTARLLLCAAYALLLSGVALLAAPSLPLQGALLFLTSLLLACAAALFLLRLRWALPGAGLLLLMWPGFALCLQMWSRGSNSSEIVLPSPVGALLPAGAALLVFLRQLSRARRWSPPLPASSHDCL